MNTFHPFGFPFISLLTLLPFAGALAVLLLGKTSRSTARLVAAIFATAAVAYTCVLWHLFQPAVQGMQLQEWHSW
jgi:NADH-quinone oxidoreductase subunit M